MNDFTYAWLVWGSITLVMFLVQAAVAAENPDGPIYLNNTDVITRNMDRLGDINKTHYEDLPDAATGQSGQNDFTDEYKVTQSWLGSWAGNNYIGDVLDMPYNLFKSMGLPEVVCNGFGSFWWGFAILLLVAMILGKER